MMAVGFMCARDFPTLLASFFFQFSNTKGVGMTGLGDGQKNKFLGFSVLISKVVEYYDFSSGESCYHVNVVLLNKDH